MSELPAGRELDAAVADKVMGWKYVEKGAIVTTPTAFPVYGSLNLADNTITLGYPVWLDEKGHVVGKVLQLALSTTGDGMLMVLEKFDADGWTTDVNYDPEEDNPALACFHGPNGKYADAEGQTRAEAVCRAALKAVTHE